MASGKDLCLWSALNFNLYIKASLKTVFLTVPNVLPIRLTLNANLSVQSEVGELHGQQGLQVPGLQELAVVGIILQRETGVATQAKILHVPDFILVFVSLKTRVKGELNGSHNAAPLYKQDSQPHQTVCRLLLEGKQLPLTCLAQTSLRRMGTRSTGRHCGCVWCHRKNVYSV